jgi:hypothetical protein
MPRAIQILLVVCSIQFVTARVSAAELLTLVHPVPHQVTQRIGAAPGEGYAHIVVRGELAADVTLEVWEYRVVNYSDHSSNDEPWRRMNVQLEGTAFTSTVLAAAGGWYRLDVRCRQDDEVLAEGSVEPIGVG